MLKMKNVRKQLFIISLTGTLVLFFSISFIQNIYAENRSVDVIKIYSTDDMIKFMENLSKIGNDYEGKTIKLMRNLDFNGRTISSSAYLDGIFDGGGHTISGIKIQKNNKPKESVGSYIFLGISKNSIIKNLMIKDSYFLTKNATVIAYSNEGIIQNCMVENCIIGNESRDQNDSALSSGICEDNSGEIINCSITNSTLNNRICSGLVSLNDGRIVNCYVAESVVYDGVAAEGLAWANRLDGVIENCYNAATVTSRDSNPTGICDFNKSKIENCYCLFEHSKHMVYQNEGVVTECDMLSRSMMPDLLDRLNSFIKMDKRLSTWVISDGISYPQLESNISCFSKKNADELTDDLLEDDTNNLETILVEKITIIPKSKKIAIGKEMLLSIKIIPETATDKRIIWESSNTKYATVDQKGVVRTKKAGAGKYVIITAMSTDGSGVKATVKLQIMRDAVTKVKISMPKKNLEAGKSIQLAADVLATGKDSNKALKWSCSNTKYATVDQKGKVKAKKAGRGKTITITAMATDGTGKKASVKLKIK